MSLKMKEFKSGRSTISKTGLQKNHQMVPPGSTIICGRTGAGKTNAMVNLLTEKSMLKNYFDRIYVFCLSPCHMLQDFCGVKEEDVFMEDNPDKLDEIIMTQKAECEKKGFEGADHILIILDDVVQSPKFLRHKCLKALFFAGTHSKISNWICTQSWMLVPRSLRQNPHSVLLFHGVTDSEIERVSRELQPAYCSKNDFSQIIRYCTDNPLLPQ